MDREAEVRAELEKLDRDAVAGRGNFDTRNTRRRELWRELKMLRGRSPVSSFPGGAQAGGHGPPAPDAP
jgi:hypothetical protein